MAPKIERGAVVLVFYPFTDLSSTKRRPALVVSTDGRPGADLILAFITSRPVKPEDTDVVLQQAETDFGPTGLATTSTVRCGKLMTLDRGLLVGRLGRLNPGQMGDVDLCLKRALALD